MLLPTQTIALRSKIKGHCFGSLQREQLGVTSMKNVSSTYVHGSSLRNFAISHDWDIRGDEIFQLHMKYVAVFRCPWNWNPTTILCRQNHESICMMQVVSSHLTNSGELFREEDTVSLKSNPDASHYASTKQLGLLAVISVLL